MEYSYFDRYSSKIKRINIPVLSYNQASNSDSRSFYKGFNNLWNYLVSIFKSNSRDYLIGRDIIVERLKTWLIKDKGRGGSYLVTGYRGMGKTSFVNRVIEQLVGVVDNIQNLFVKILFFLISFWPIFYYLLNIYNKGDQTSWEEIYSFGFNRETFLLYIIPLFLSVIWWTAARWPIVREKIKKWHFFIHTFFIALFREHHWISPFKITPREWNRINNLMYGGDKKDASYSRVCVKINLGQEILREKDILSVLTYQLYEKWKRYCNCFAITELEKSAITAIFSFIAQVAFLLIFDKLIQEDNELFKFLAINDLLSYKVLIQLVICILLFLFSHVILSWRRQSIKRRLNHLNKSIDAQREHKKGSSIFFKKSGKFSEGSISADEVNTYRYDVADTRVIESQLIEILDYIAFGYLAPTLYFVFDELDKIEDINYVSDNKIPEYSNERNFPGGGASRQRKHAVMKLLANLKYFTTTAKAKFIFIAGREMYDGFLADFTDREAAASSLFDGVIYVESFCKNEKSDRNVTYNAETFIARQLIPRSYIKNRVIQELIECKLKGEVYDNIDIDLRMYYEYLLLEYAHCASQVDSEIQKKYFDDSRKCIDRIIILLYHFSVYLFQISNGSPKKMHINFANYVRLIKNPKEFQLKKGFKKSPFENSDLDILISEKPKFLLTFTEKEQRVIGFIHYISFPVNQIMSNADRFSDKLLVSASFLVNHIYKFHKSGFSWRNLEQIPELLEVYKIPEFRSFIHSILNYLLQTHIIQIQGGLYDFKFRKQISEEISIASKTSEDISAIYNFTLDDSQSVKRHYLSLLDQLGRNKESRIQNSSSMAAYYHILGDLYMSDEEYNNALSQYKIALKYLYNDDNFASINQKDNNTLKNPKLILSIIRTLLKIGAAYEKRRSNLSAYAAYEDIISLLFYYRFFDEKEFGLRYEVVQKLQWPEHEAELYPKNQVIIKGEKSNLKNIEPIISKDNKDSSVQGIVYKTRGSRIISDFSNLITPEKHEVQQRLSLIGDTKFVFQAMLAKLFVLEKIELGGITRENLDVIEGEFRYLHLATNVHEKFIIAADFYRRLGDIMYYKNGLIGFNFKHESQDESSTDLNECFVDSLYYYGFVLKTELHDFCQKNNCFEHFAHILDCSRMLEKKDFDRIQAGEEIEDSTIIRYFDKKQIDNNKSIKKVVRLFWKDPIVKEKITSIPLDDVANCNKNRKDYWVKNRTLPCYACRFYHHSLEIMMNNWIGVKFNKGERKAISVLRQIALCGSARSSRQIFNLQYAEILDTLGNTMFSCSSAKEEIRTEFFIYFMHDTHVLIEILDNNGKLDGVGSDPINELLLLKFANNDGAPKSHLESAMLYYLEASFLFRISNELKKAVGSLHKIIKILLNYLRVSGRYSDNEIEIKHYIHSRSLIGEMIYDIKDLLVRQCLILLYNHYNFINIMEIQRLKWIFYTDMYEGISLTQLSLFPDIEEIMLNYYEILKLCVRLDQKIEMDNEINRVKEFRQLISTTNDNHFQFNKNVSWSSIKERNRIFNSQLIDLYNNMSMGALRNESTVYGRMLSLRLKSKMNEYILKLAFPNIKFIIQGDKEYYYLEYLGTNYITNNENIDSLEWKGYYKEIEIKDPHVDSRIDYDRIFLFEFLIKDSIFCLTEILETVTPYTTTTLFTDAFMAGIYYSLYKWSNLFEELLLFYKVFDTISSTRHDRVSANFSWANEFFENYDSFFNKESNFEDFRKFQNYVTSNMSTDEITELANNYCKIWNCRNISERFYNSVVKAISKPNVYYTLKNYAGEMALHFFRRTKEINREGKAYKDMINSMFFLDDNLKNDTIQFDLAVERFRINSDEIDRQLNNIKKAISPSIYDVDRFRKNTETELPLSNRFDDLTMNINF